MTGSYPVGCRQRRWIGEFSPLPSIRGPAASSANEFCEVALGGLITIPKGVAFLRVTGIAGQAGVGSEFKVLPLVFSNMPAGLFFFMLATFQIIVFSWGWGMKKGMRELERGAFIKVSGILRSIIKWVCPVFLLN
jgi:SNF family Na+-dependent transporter